MEMEMETGMIEVGIRGYDCAVGGVSTTLEAA